MSEVKSKTDDVLAKLEESRNETILQVTENCPVRSIREVADDGSDVYLGDVGFERCRWHEIQDEDERKRMVDENQAKVPGDPTIVWSIGGLFEVCVPHAWNSNCMRCLDYLAPSHHGQGIMSSAVGTLLHEWAIPRMLVSNMRVSVLEGNQGSVRVFEKNGFRVTETLRDCIEFRG